MATELGKAYVQIVPSARGISGSISNVLNGESVSAGTSAGQNIVSSLKKVLVTAGLGKVLKDALFAGGELEQSLGGVKSIFGEISGDTVSKQAFQAWQTVGMSANKYMENATLFGAAYSKTMSDTNDMAKLTDVALRTAGDTANRFGLDMGYVTEAYQSLMRGNYAMLDSIAPGYAGTKAGLQELIKDTAGYAEEQKKLGLTVDESDMSFENITKALAVYNEHMGITGTTQAEAAETLTGSLDAMKASWVNLLGILTTGEGDLAYAMESMVVSIGNFGKNVLRMIGNLVSNLPQLFSSLASSLPQLIEQIINAFSSGFPKFVDAGVKMVDSIASGLATGIPNLISKIGPMLVEFSGSLRTNASKLVDAGLNLIVQLAQGIANSLPTLIQTVPKIISNIAGIINDNMPKILATGVKIIGILAMGLIQAIPTLIANIPSIIKAIVDVFTAFNWLNLGGTLLKSIGSGISSAVGSLISAAKQSMSAFIEAVKSFFPNLIAQGKSMIFKIITGAIENMYRFTGLPSKIFSAIVSKFRDINWSSIGTNIIKGIVNGVKAAAGKLLSAMKNLASNALKAAKKKLGIHSPSKVFSDEVGQWIPAGIEEGISSNTRGLNRAISDMADEALNNSKSLLNLGNLIGLDNMSLNANDNQSQYILDKMNNMLEILFAISQKDTNVYVGTKEIELRSAQRAIDKINARASSLARMRGV